MKNSMQLMQMLASSLAFLLADISYVQADHATHSKRILTSKNSPSITLDGSALFTYSNRSGLRDDQIFIQVLGINPRTGRQCFIQYDRQGNPGYVDVRGEVDSRKYAYSLAYFPNAQEKNGRLISLPQLNGARLYTSIKEKISFPVLKNELVQWTINAPNPLNASDPNRNILWDKTEFAVNPYAIFINPTAVDNFSLPLYCEETGKDGSKQSGGILVSRSMVFKQLEVDFQQAGAPWTALISQTPSIVYAPIYAAATGIISQELLVASGWIEAFKNLYSTTPLLIDTEESFPADKGGGIWEGIINPETNVITFTRVVDEQHPPIPASQITLPTNLSELLAGCGPSWNIETDNHLQLVFARNLSCAIDTNTLSTTEAIGLRYFRSHRSEFYQPNPSMPNELQFIDYYSKGLHSYGDHQIYTLPYDDELEQSGAASYTPENFAGGKIFLGPL